MVSFEICGGNPGCLSFLMAAYKLDPFSAEIGFHRMAHYGITATKLYMLWNDCCGRNAAQALFIMRNCDPEIIRTHINYEGGRGIPFSEKEIDELEEKAACVNVGVIHKNQRREPWISKS